MNPSSINWLAVIAAGISAFAVGGIWYSRGIFGNAWMTDSKLTEDDIKQGNKGKIFGFTAIFSLLMAVNLAMFLADSPGHITDVSWGATAGFLAGIWTFCAIAIHSLFELKSWRHIFINGGYSIVSLTLMGAIIGLWR
ncbi:DUF1761 domain-containing protein [Mucilaginibacter ginsenosidivorans]|uniref:DUF1761 domain-containing protein n=1 Tax=Mucilaginibacter ginsenosidivorans TaxID=398053 RepID=A0A5B8UXC9_9SPHI|nr:DUF1761 domain-containing protein [Mucilaginibacter ginsenosidivorans]QEC63602.1 DUF1761 domain-containing protein [Mucilaginibacter ginsenosidivorans]